MKNQGSPNKRFISGQRTEDKQLCNMYNIDWNHQSKIDLKKMKNKIGKESNTHRKTVKRSLMLSNQ